MTTTEQREKMRTCPNCGKVHAHEYYDRWRCPNCQHIVCFHCRRSIRCRNCGTADYIRIKR